MYEMTTNAPAGSPIARWFGFVFTAGVMASASAQVAVEGIEVTQAVQDMAHTVTLDGTAGRRSVARDAHLVRGPPAGGIPQRGTGAHDDHCGDHSADS